MSWLRSSPLRSSFTKTRSRDSPPKDADPTACYDSFCKHWQQSYDIISQSMPTRGIPSQDDVLGVVNHVDRMATLLLLELGDFIPNGQSRLHMNVIPAQLQSHCSPCLEYLLSEKLLDKLYQWSLHTGRFGNAVKMEQLKLYEILVSHSSYLLTHESITKPLLKLLNECTGDILPFEVEKKLVTLLNHLCVALVQNTELLDLFFQPSATGKNRFIIFTLLIPHIHREGGVGQLARDAMLLCMSLSKKNDDIGMYIADDSNICPVLATGLSGLYSLLPRTLDIETEDWHRLTVDDINDFPALTQLMNSLEFCNAVAQVAHPLVQKHLREFLYRGFLVPVIGSALLQESIGLSLEQLQSPQFLVRITHRISIKTNFEYHFYSACWTSSEELVAATAYFDLFIRSVTDPGLLYPMIKFLLEDNYDGHPILDYLIKRIAYRSRLSIVTLALFETLVDLNCEDIMLKLCLSSLTPCSHIMWSQRSRLRDLDPRGAEKFISLTPECCFPSLPVPLTRNLFMPSSLPHISNEKEPLPPTLIAESLYSNYHAYLRDARHKISSCQLACSIWSCQYEDAGEQLKDKSSNNRYLNNANNNDDVELNKNSMKDISKDKVREANDDEEKCNTRKMINEVSEASLDITVTPEEQAKLDADIAELLGENTGSLIESAADITPTTFEKILFCDEEPSMMNSLQLSIGESSGYESFAFKGSSESTPDNDEDDETFKDHIIGQDIEEVEEENEEVTLENQDITNLTLKNIKVDILTEVLEHPLTKNQRHKFNNDSPDVTNIEQPSVGSFLDEILRKLENMTENSVYVNLHLTGLISRLAIYPQPLLKSFLLNHSLVFQPSIRSLFQVLASLKQKIDRFLAKHPAESVEFFLQQAKVFLIERESRIINMRKIALEAASNGLHSITFKNTDKIVAQKDESKRKSLTLSISQMFKRSVNSSNNDTMMISNSHNNNSGEEMKIFSDPNSKHSRIQNVVLSAVILDEWLKELAAITQEHTIVNLLNNGTSAS